VLGERMNSITIEAKKEKPTLVMDLSEIHVKGSEYNN